MTTRREFLQLGAGALAGIALRRLRPAGRRAGASPGAAPRGGGERQARQDRRRPRALRRARGAGADEPEARGAGRCRPDLDMATQVSERLRAMDEQGIDVEALSINPELVQGRPRPRASRSSRSRTRSSPRRAPRTPTASSPSPRWRCSTRISPPSSSRKASRSTGCAAPAIGGSVNGEEISDPKFHPFWAKAEQLGVLVFIHPQGAGAPAELAAAASRATATSAT